MNSFMVSTFPTLLKDFRIPPETFENLFLVKFG